MQVQRDEQDAQGPHQQFGDEARHVGSAGVEYSGGIQADLGVDELARHVESGMGRVKTESHQRPQHQLAEY